MKPIIVGLGEILWDMLPSGKPLRQAQDLSRAEPTDKQLGGAPANFAYHANALGAQGVVASCIGADDLGREMTERLNGLSLVRDYVAVDSSHPTGTVSVKLDADGKPSYTIHENVAWDFIPDSAQLKTLARLADAVCFGSLAQRSEVSRRTIRAFLGCTQQKALRIFDVNLRQSYYSLEVIEESLQMCNVVKLNNDELPVLAKLLGLEGDENAMVKALARRYGLALVALTRGPQGSLLTTATKMSVHPGVPVEVVDTVGAGDAFTAVLAVGMLKKYELNRINDCANRLASFVCSQTGATPALPQEIRALFLEP
jgi:fructokinase